MTPMQAQAAHDAARAAPATAAEYARAIRRMLTVGEWDGFHPMPADEDQADGWVLRSTWWPPTGAVTHRWERTRQHCPEHGKRRPGQWLTHVLFDPERTFPTFLKVLAALDERARDGAA